MRLDLKEFRRRITWSGRKLADIAHGKRLAFQKERGACQIVAERLEGRTLFTWGTAGFLAGLTPDLSTGAETFSTSTDTSGHVVFVSPFPQLASAEVTTTTSTDSTDFDIIYTSPLGHEVDATTIDQTLAVTDVPSVQAETTVPVIATLSGIRAADGTITPAGMITSAQDAQSVDAIYVLSPATPRNWATSDTGNVHVALNTSVADTNGNIINSAAEFGAFQLDVEAVGNVLGLGTLVGSGKPIPNSIVAGKNFGGLAQYQFPDGPRKTIRLGPPANDLVKMQVTNLTSEAIHEPVQFTLYTCRTNASLDGATMQSNVNVRLNMAAGATQTVRLTDNFYWRVAPGQYYILVTAFAKGSPGVQMRDIASGVASSAPVQVIAPSAHLVTMSVTPTRSTLASGQNLVLATVQNIGNTPVSGVATATISATVNGASASVTTSLSFIQVFPGKTQRLRIPFHFATPPPAGAYQLTVAINLASNLDNANNTATTAGRVLVK